MLNTESINNATMMPISAGKAIRAIVPNNPPSQ